MLDDASVEFDDVVFAHPLRLAGVSIDRVTMAIVRVRAGDRRGIGASMLSVPWAWPSNPEIPWAVKDQALRELTVSLAAAAIGQDEVPHLKAPNMPELAAALAFGAVDNAIHDLLGSMPPPLRRRLPVQHVLGVDDPLEPPPDGIKHLKLKLSGRSPEADAARTVAAFDLTHAASLSLDPNEGYADTAAVVEMLERIRANHPAAYEAVAYVEQPLPRDASPDPAGMRAIGRLKPVVIDEGLAHADQLAALPDLGWSGLVIKASKGQSLALHAHEFAMRHNMFVTIQDLTAVDVALVHSARLAAALPWSQPAFECNSRQYCPAANERLEREMPGLVQVRDGCIAVDPVEVS